MKQKILLLTVAIVISAVSFSQSADFKQQIGLSAKASTNGFGGDVYYQPIPKLAIKAGVSYLSFTVNSNTLESFIGEDINVTIANPLGNDIMFDADAKFKTGALSIAVGYQPFKLFYITAGVGKSLFDSEVIGSPTTDINFGQYDIPNMGIVAPQLTKEKLGSFHIDVKSSNTIIPYLGIGLGSFVPQNKKVSFALEVGAYYVGNYSLAYTLPPGLNIQSIDYGLSLSPEQKDQLSSLVNDEVDRVVRELDSEVGNAIDDINSKLKDFKFYPVLKLTIGFRAFEF